MRLAAPRLVLNLALLAAMTQAQEMKLSPQLKSFELHLSWMDWTGAPLYPEQAPLFHLELRNHGNAPRTVEDLENNIDTPVWRLYDAHGKLLGSYNPYGRKQRLLGDMSRKAVGQPLTLEVAPGETNSTDVNLWNYRDPLAPGNYAAEGIHTPLDDGPPLTSNRLPFSIVEARVEDAAVGYDSPLNTTTLTAWLASDGKPAAPGRLLVRMSANTGYYVTGQGANPFADFPHGARVAVGGYPPDSMVTRQGWVAVAWEGHVELFRHALAESNWRSGAFDLPLGDPVPVPRFPDRGHAVFLATGKTRDGFALAGAVVRQGETGPPKPWLVRLAAQPKLAACAFWMDRPIALLLVTDNGAESRFARLDVDENGKVVSVERTVRTTPNQVLAVTQLTRPGSVPTFLALEADRKEPNRVGIVRLPLKGNPAAAELRPMPGWPPDAPTAVQLEMAPDRTLYIALTDQHGAFYAGRADGSLVKFRDEGASFPHVSANARSAAYACFTSRGYLFYAGR